MTFLVNSFLTGSAPLADSPFADDAANFGFASVSTFPAAFYDATGDKTWIGWEAFMGGVRAARVAVYDHAAATWSAAYTVSQNSMADDGHGTPAICMDGNGRVHCFFGSHNGVLRHSMTVGVRDPAQWRELAGIGTDLTYPHPVLVGSTLYLFARGNSLQTLYRYKGTVAADSVSWGAAQAVFTFTGGRFYLGSLFANGTMIEGFATYADSGYTFSRDIYHFRYDTSDDSVDNSGGGVSTAVGSQPISLATADASYKVYDQTSNDSSIPAACLTPDGKLHLAFLNSAATPFNIDYMVYSGGSWSSAATITTTTGIDVAGNGYHSGPTLVPRADNSVEMWFANDDTASFTAGGVMKRIVRASGGTWGSVSSMLSPSGSLGLDRPTTVRDGDPDLLVLFSEDTGDELDSSAGGLKAYAHGDGGFVARDLTPASDPGTTSPSSDAYFYNVALQATFTGSNGSTSFSDSSRYAHSLTAVGNAQIQGNKLDLDGTGDYVSVADSWAWQFGSRFTIELFGVEFDDTASDQVLIAQYRATTGNRSWILRYDGTVDALALDVVESGGSVVRTVAAADFSPSTGGVEYDIAVAWDGFMFSILVNGVRLNMSGGPSSFVDAAQVVTIGCDFDSSNVARRFFNGRIEALRITRGVDRTGTGATYTRHALPLTTTQATLTDSEWGNVVLLVEGLANGEIRDASPYDWPVSKFGNIAVSTSVEPFSGARSLALDGTGDYLSIGDAAPLQFGAGNWTVETMVRHSVNTAANTYVSKWTGDGTNGREWSLRYRGDSATDVLETLRSSTGSGTSDTSNTAAWTPTTGTWYHAALSVVGPNSLRMFIDGTQSGATDTTSVTIADTAAPIRVGALSSSGAIANEMNGYLSELRITKAARYTANFTAPSAAFPRG